MALKQRGPTTSLAKRGQIVGLANLKGDRRLSLKEIAAITKISLSTCSDIICFSALRMSETHILDPCSPENLRPRPTAVKGSNQALSPEEKERVNFIALARSLTQTGLNNTCNTVVAPPSHIWT